MNIISTLSPTAGVIGGDLFATTDAFGTAGNNTLNGSITGVHMYGLAGNDIYNVVSTLDRVIEVRNEGFDTIRTALSSYVIPDFVERLTYTGTGDFTGTGNALANIINGGIGNDWLDGGLGNDQLQGGAGNDTYVVDSTLDKLTELANEGFDTIRTSLSSYVIPDYFDGLTYTGTGDFTGTGNAGANTLIGGAGNDWLDGSYAADIM